MKGSRQDDQHAEELSQGLASGVDRSAVDPSAQLPFVAVPVARFVLMSLATFSLYELWWFYKNWSRVKERTGSDIRPFWRAVFAPFYCYLFVKTVRSTSEKVSVPASLSAGVIALAWFALLLCERLPDPWWWLSLATFVPLVPVVRHIEQLHATVYPGFETHAPFGRGHVLALVCLLPLTALALLGTLAPDTRALYGSELPEAYRETLVEKGHIDSGEQVLFFYSAGIFSIEEDGNIATDRRVISYETREDTLWRESVPYEGIALLETTWSESALEDTVVTVTTADDRIFSLVISPEGGRDREFVEKIEALRVAHASVD
jgi:hypothetical protein